MMLSSVIWLLIYLLGFAAILLCVVSCVLLVVTERRPHVEILAGESEYYDPRTGTSLAFPAPHQPPTLHLSVVVPAYNEEERLPPMLDEALAYLERRKELRRDYRYEIIVVSDGSSDGTVRVAHDYAKRHGAQTVKCLQLARNRGKGGAVRMGVLRASGATILFADADGATTFEDINKLENALQVAADAITNLDPYSDSLAIAIGSRAHLEKESLASRSVFRTILMYGFHFLVWLFTVRNIRDTQCGFKLFTRKAARMCFESLHVDRWAFDVELLYIAQRLDIPIREISVRWTEVEGSKVTPVWSWLQMGCDLGLIWFKYKIGAWQLCNSKND